MSSVYRDDSTRCRRRMRPLLPSLWRKEIVPADFRSLRTARWAVCIYTTQPPGFLPGWCCRRRDSGVAVDRGRSHFLHLEFQNAYYFYPDRRNFRRGADGRFAASYRASTRAQIL